MFTYLIDLKLNHKYQIRFYMFSFFVILDLLKQDEKGDTGLKIAVYNNNIEKTREIIQQASQLNILKELINKTDHERRSPLYIACWKGRDSIAQLLLSKKANINLSKKDGTSPLLVAAQIGQSNVVQTLSSHKADINLSDKDGYSPLFVAAENNHSNVVQILIDNNASINQAKNNGVTPLWQACQNGHLNTVELLLNNKADPYKIRNDGTTAIYQAAFKGHSKIVVKLLDNNFPVNHKSFYNLTILHAAAQGNKIDVVKAICERDKEKELINEDRNEWNDTPLIAGIREEAGIDVVRLLISFGADPEKKGNGKTSLQLAETKGKEEVANYLRSIIDNKHSI